MLTLRFWLALTATALFLLSVFHLADWAIRWRRRPVRLDSRRRVSCPPDAGAGNRPRPEADVAGNGPRGTAAGHVLHFENNYTSRMEDKLRRLELEATLHVGRKRVH